MRILKPKYFLNKQLKDKKVGEVDTYPAYFRFTIGKSNHRVKSYLIGYLKDEGCFESFTKEMQVEKDVINYLYSRYHDYTFDNFNADAFYLCSPLSKLLDLYISTYFDEELGDTAGDAYNKELITYTAAKTKISEEFLRKSMNSQFESSVPSNFIKSKRLALVVETFNYSLDFEKKSDIVFCMYNWNTSNIRDQFLNSFGSEHTNFIDYIIQLYSSSINPRL